MKTVSCNRGLMRMLKKRETKENTVVWLHLYHTIFVSYRVGLILDRIGLFGEFQCMVCWKESGVTGAAHQNADKLHTLLRNVSCHRQVRGMLLQKSSHTLPKIRKDSQKSFRKSANPHICVRKSKNPINLKKVQ